MTNKNEHLSNGAKEKRNAIVKSLASKTDTVQAVLDEAVKDNTKTSLIPIATPKKYI